MPRKSSKSAAKPTPFLRTRRSARATTASDTRELLRLVDSIQTSSRISAKYSEISLDSVICLEEGGRQGGAAAVPSGAPIFAKTLPSNLRKPFSAQRARSQCGGMIPAKTVVVPVSHRERLRSPVGPATVEAKFDISKGSSVLLEHALPAKAVAR